MKHLLCCDWGTTNFRLYLVKIDTQEILGQVKDKIGIKKIHDDWQKVNKDRITYYRLFLQHKIEQLGQLLQLDLNQIPIISSGMISSSIGITEVPYTTLPFDFNNPNLKFEKITPNELFSNELFIFGGLSSNNDVMRGEETQVLGLKDFLFEDCLCILPGTHSKHIFIKKNQIVDFKTYMTGEIFDLLSTQSILKDSIAKPKKINKEYFKKGIEHALKTNIFNSLFKIRSSTLLSQSSEKNNYAYLSGLVIGTEIKTLQNLDNPIILAGSKPLLNLYQLAFEILGINKKLTTISNKTFESSIPKAATYLLKNLKL